MEQIGRSPVHLIFFTPGDTPDVSTFRVISSARIHYARQASHDARRPDPPVGKFGAIVPEWNDAKNSDMYVSGKRYADNELRKGEQ